MAPVLKTGIPERVSGVRIPPSPPHSLNCREVLPSRLQALLPCLSTLTVFPPEAPPLVILEATTRQVFPTPPCDKEKPSTYDRPLCFSFLADRAFADLLDAPTFQQVSLTLCLTGEWKRNWHQS